MVDESSTINTFGIALSPTVIVSGCPGLELTLSVIVIYLIGMLSAKFSCFLPELEYALTLSREVQRSFRLTEE
jgi:hypothetical protein